MVVEVKPFTPSLAVYDVGDAHRLFDNGALLSLYLQTTPYPENDQGARLFTYNKYTSSDILLALSRSFDFNRFSSFLRGLAWENHLTPTAKVASLPCQCHDCKRGSGCGQHLFTCSVPIFQRSSRDEPPEQQNGIKEVREDGNLLMIPGIHQGRPEEFMLSSAHAQVFLYPFGSWQHRYSRIEALVCGDGVASGQLHSVPANYVLDLLTTACAGWEDLIECSRKFLSRMV
ncbi:hypothetical protein HOY82DRAFT_63271 [Tuber indicum]|nr:hypothetical protein HOY82DRAFT_63271 [Tuber indicum]